MIFNRIISKPTLIFILASILLLIGIPYGIYGLTLDGGASLGGVLILLADLLIFILLVIDRAIVKLISPLKLSIYEFVFLILGITIYMYSQRKIIVEIESENIEYLLVIENPGNLINNKIHWEFPFDQRIYTKESIVIVDKIIGNVDFNIHADWNNSYYYNKYEFEKYPEVKLYCRTNFALKKDLNQKMIDSLMNKK